MLFGGRVGIDLSGIDIVDSQETVSLYLWHDRLSLQLQHTISSDAGAMHKDESVEKGSMYAACS